MSPPVEPIFKRRPDRKGRRFALAALLTVIVYAGLVLVVGLVSLLGWMGEPRSLFKKPEAVSLVNLPAAQWEQNRRVRSAPRTAQNTPPPEQKKEQKKEPLPKGQVVDVAPGNDQKPPDDAKYLAEHNNKVAKQTRAKHQTAFYRNAMPHRTTTVPKSQTQGADNVPKPQVASNQGISNDARPPQKGAQAGHFDVPSAKKRDKVALLDKAPRGDIQNHAASDGVKGNSNHLDITPGPLGQQSGPAASQGQKGDQNVANLMPSQATLDKIAGDAPNDDLDDVDQGDSTFLNTREFKYASFFNRVKQSVGEHWDPSRPLRERDPEGKIYAYKDRYTLLAVTLDDSGRLLRVSVSKSCGVDFLDDEAVAAFERAQPFPNPPPGLVDHGEVRFSFGFFLEVNSGSNLRIFRSRD